MRAVASAALQKWWDAPLSAFAMQIGFLSNGRFTYLGKYINEFSLCIVLTLHPDCHSQLLVEPSSLFSSVAS